MKKIAFLFSLLCAMVLAACGDSSEFRVAGTVNGLGTQNLWIYYYANDAVRCQNTILLDGKFSFVGYSEEPTIVEIYSTDKVLLAMLMVQNGQTVDCILDKGGRYNVEFEGNDVSHEWGKFLAENRDALASGNPALRNSVIQKYVVDHPQNILSTVLMLTEYDAIDNELMADSLLHMIAPEARPRYLIGAYQEMLAKFNSEKAQGTVSPINLFSKGDTIYVFNPKLTTVSVLAFSETSTTERDSLVARLREWHSANREKKLNVVDIAFAPDTVAWKKAIKEDDAKWNQCWALGGVEAKGVDRLAIPRTPYFVVTDSTGSQVYRGSSMARATAVIDSLTVKKQ